MKSIAIFTSGHSRGTNFVAIYNYLRENHLPIKIEYLLVTDLNAPIVHIAHNLHICIVQFDNHYRINDFLLSLSKKKPVNLIVLAGFMRKLNKEFISLAGAPIINIHPSLLPKFGGKGMYGRIVHEAVFEAGEVISGATIHYVNEMYDEGAVIKQVKCDITDCHSADDIAQKVLNLENEIYPKIIVDLIKTM